MPNQKTNDPSLDIVQKTMLENWRNDRLPHFCLISANESEQDKAQVLRDWTTTLLAQIWKLEGKTLAPDWQSHPSFLQHPDFTSIEIEGPRALVEAPEVVQWLQQLDYNPMELKYKWVVWHECEKITNTLANKLLKTLEEPPKRTVILFTTTDKSPLLATIESRAIKIRLPKNQSQEKSLTAQKEETLIQYLERVAQLCDNEFYQQLTPLLKVGELHETLEFLKKNKQSSHQLLTHILDYERSKGSSTQALDALNKRMQWFKKSETFNHGAAERWLTMLSPYL